MLDAEKEVQLAKVKASLVDDLQNKNQELMKQIEISQVAEYYIYHHSLPTVLDYDEDIILMLNFNG